MDIMMPEMDGLTAIRKVREDEKYNSLPIIALTARAMKGDDKECLNAGANAYVSKPVDSKLLFDKIKSFLKAA